MLEQNKMKVERQKAKNIRVVVGQGKNRKYHYDNICLSMNGKFREGEVGQYVAN